MTTASCMRAFLVVLDTIRRLPSRLAGGRRCPCCHIAETTAVSNPASRERSACDCANWASCCTSESSTVPTRKVFDRGPGGAGGGAAGGGGAGAADVVLRPVSWRRVVASPFVVGVVPEV